MPIMGTESSLNFLSNDELNEQLANQDGSNPPHGFFDWELTKAGLGRENLIGQGLTSLNDARESLFTSRTDPVTEEQLPELIDGYEDHAELFVGANTIEDFNLIKKKIDRDEKQKRILRNTTWGGYANTLLTANLDPTILIPGSIASKAALAKIANPLFRTVAGFGSSAAAAGIAIGIKEKLLSEMQITRSQEEAAQNVINGMVINGLIGAGSALLTKPAKEAINLSFDAIFGNHFDAQGNLTIEGPIVSMSQGPMGPNSAPLGMMGPPKPPSPKPTGPSGNSLSPIANPSSSTGSTMGSAGSAGGNSGNVGGSNALTNPPANPLANLPYDALKRQYSLKHLENVEGWAAKKMAQRLAISGPIPILTTSPTGYGMKSPFATTREFTANMLEIGGSLNLNLTETPNKASSGRYQASASPIALQTKIQADERHLLNLHRQLNELQKEHDIYTPRSQRYKEDVFFEEIGDSNRYSDVHIDQYVDKGAKLSRAFFEHHHNRMKALGWSDDTIDEVLGADSYFHRLLKTNDYVADFHKTQSQHGISGPVELYERHIKNQNAEILLGNKIYYPKGRKDAYHAQQKMEEAFTQAINAQGPHALSQADLNEVYRLRSANLPYGHILKRSPLQSVHNLVDEAQDHLAKADLHLVKLVPLNQIHEKALERANARLGLKDEDLTNPILSQLIGSTANPLKPRVDDIPDSLLKPYLHDNVKHVTSAFHRKLSPLLTLAEHLKEQGMSSLEQWQLRLGQEFKLSSEAKNLTDKEMTALHQQYQSDKEFLNNVTDILLNHRGNRSLSEWEKLGEMARLYNHAKLGGMIPISALTDAIQMAVERGLAPLFKDVLVPMANVFKKYPLTNLESADLAHAAEGILYNRSDTWSSIFDANLSESATKRFLSFASNNINKITFMNWFTRLWRTLYARKAVSQTLRDVETYALKGKLNPRTMQHLARIGLDQNDWLGLYQQFKQFGEVDGLTYIANLEQWADQKLALKLRQAILKDTNNTIVTGNKADSPLWAQMSGMGKVVNNYRSFFSAAHNRIFIPWMQKIASGDLSFISDAILKMGFGYFVYCLIKTIRKEAISTDWKTIVHEGLDRSGLLGQFMEGYNALNKWGIVKWATDGEFGAEEASRFKSRGALGTLLGPTFGIIDDIYATVQSLIKEGRFTDKDALRLFHLLPWVRVWYWQTTLDELVSEFAVDQGAKDTREPDSGF